MLSALLHWSGCGRLRVSDVTGWVAVVDHGLSLSKIPLADGSLDQKWSLLNQGNKPAVSVLLHTAPWDGSEGLIMERAISLSSWSVVDELEDIVSPIKRRKYIPDTQSVCEHHSLSALSASPCLCSLLYLYVSHLIATSELGKPFNCA